MYIYYFPKVAKCTFERFGPTGTIEVFDGLCVLPINIINEKIYIFLWFWFVLLGRNSIELSSLPSLLSIYFTYNVGFFKHILFIDSLTLAIEELPPKPQTRHGVIVSHVRGHHVLC